MIKNQKGLPAQTGAAPLIIVGIIVIVAVAGYLLYSQGKLPFSLPGASTVPRATEKDFEFIEDAMLRKHMVAQTNQATYRTKVLSEGAGLVFINEFQIKGENFNTHEVQQEPSGKELKNKIEIADTVYVKDYSDNKWWKQTINLEDVPEEEKENEPSDFKEEYSKPDLKYKSLGKESCGTSTSSGLTCFKYEQLGLGITRTFWFDDKQYLLRKDEAGYGEFITKIEYSYDNINITAPSPTKDVAEGKSVYDYYYGTGTPANLPQNYSLPEDFPTDLPEIPSLEDIGY